MSLILKGSPSGTVYAESNEANLTGSTKVSVYLLVVPSTTVSSPFVFLSDADLDSSPRGFYIRQDSPTLMTLGWETTLGGNEYQFAVTNTTTHIFAEYDISAQTINYYTSSSTPSDTKTSVGLPVDLSKFCLRLTSSSVSGEDVTIGDIATWHNGGPSVAAKDAAFNGDYVGYEFKDSGCTDKYLFSGVTSTSNITFSSITRQGYFLDLEREPTGGDPFSICGDYLPAVLRDFKTQVSSPTPADSSQQHGFVNLAKVARVVVNYESQTVYGEKLENLSDHYNPITDRWTSLPTYSGMPSYISPVDLLLTPRDAADTYVLEWEGNGVMVISGSNTTVLNQPNRIEFRGGLALGLRSIPAGGYISNIRCYLKEDEAIVNSGRMFSPESMEYMGRYDVLRMMDFNRTPTTNYNSYDDYVEYTRCTYSGVPAPIRAQIQLAIEADTELWFNIPVFLGTTEKLDFATMDARTWGESQGPLLQQSVIDSFFDSFIADLVAMKWPVSKRILLELHNELWNFAYPFSYATNYAWGVGDWLNTNGFPSLGFLGGAGYLSIRMMDAFEQALARAGRQAQVWAPVLGVQTANAPLTNNAFNGMDAYISLTGSSFDKTRYIVATTGYTYADIGWDSGNDFLGQTYANETDYYNELKTRIAANDAATKQIYLRSQILDSLEKHIAHTEIHKGHMATHGITNPIEEYEGSDHNTELSQVFNDDPILNTFLLSFNDGEEGAAVQRLSNELFIYHNEGGSMSNFCLVGPTTPNSAWFEGETWEELYTSPKGLVWLDYISETALDDEAVWSSYQAQFTSDPVITINVIATDDIIDDTEASSNLSLTGTTSNVEDGRIVTVTLNGETYTGSVTSDAWSVSIPSADLQQLPASAVVYADVSNLAGDPAPTAVRSITRDTNITYSYKFVLTGEGNELYEVGGSKLTNTTLDKVVLRPTWDSSTVHQILTNVSVDSDGYIDTTLNFGSNGQIVDVLIQKGDQMWALQNQTLVEVSS